MKRRYARVQLQMQNTVRGTLHEDPEEQTDSSMNRDHM